MLKFHRQNNFVPILVHKFQDPGTGFFEIFLDELAIRVTKLLARALVEKLGCEACHMVFFGDFVFEIIMISSMLLLFGFV